jgi:uncharacterized protein
VTYLSPGVYVEEVSSGPQPIAAAPTSVVAILGTTRKGPVLTPTRVTGWADFVRTFGAASARGYLAESVFGFFSNGGPAAWVVRVDPSSSASWKAYDVSGTESFVITARSPGTWGNALGINLRADASGASGAYYRATTTGPTVSVTNAGPFTLQVPSTAGLKPGDTLALIPVPAVANPVPATVSSLGPTSITLTTTVAGPTAMTTGSVVASATASSTSMYLASGKGFRKGDVVVATHPNGTRSSARVVDVVPAGTAVTSTQP